MVHTMTFVSALIRTARRARHTPVLATGLPDGREVLLDAPDARLAPALVSAALGEYEAAAELLATTRELAEWENRDRYTVRLAAFAVGRPDWLANWLAVAPATRTRCSSRRSSRSSGPGARRPGPSGCARWRR